MKHDLDPRHLNIDNFGKARGQLQDALPLAEFDRLLEEAQGMSPDTAVHFSAQGDLRAGADGTEQVWLVLRGQVDLPQTCQRCLGTVAAPVHFEREFRFVATEEVAAVEDETSEEDVLVTARDFNLLELVEDELLMALPAVPKHEVCPDAVKLQVADADFVETTQEKPNPFAVLGQLKRKP